MLFLQRSDVLPAQSRCNGRIRPQPEFILAKESEIIVKGEALGVAAVALGENIADVEVREFVDDRIRGKLGSGVDVQQASPQVIVEALHVVAVVFAAKFEGMVPANPRVVVQYLKCFA